MREVVEETICCCVTISVENDAENSCENTTSGPDDPFCLSCEHRHAGNAAVMAGEVVVTERLPEVVT